MGTGLTNIPKLPMYCIHKYYGIEEMLTLVEHLVFTCELLNS